MICETCEQKFQETAVKIYKGRKVCPSCFRTLMASDVPDANRQVRVVQTQAVVTTVCPECNAEVHKDTRICPHCGTKVKRIDRMGDHVITVTKNIYYIYYIIIRCVALGLSSFGVLVGIFGMFAAENWVARICYLVLATYFGTFLGYLIIRYYRHVNSN